MLLRSQILRLGPSATYHPAAVAQQPTIANLSTARPSGVGTYTPHPGYLGGSTPYTPRADPPTTIDVKQNRRYVAGVVMPTGMATMLDIVGMAGEDGSIALPNLDAIGATGWSNVLVYPADKAPAITPAGHTGHTHVAVATRSGPDQTIDLAQPPYQGVVLWMADAYPDQPTPVPGDDGNTAGSTTTTPGTPAPGQLVPGVSNWWLAGGAAAVLVGGYFLLK